LALVLAGRITPGRETFQSWAWRLRGRRNLLLDHLMGERSLNPLVLLVYCQIAPLVFIATIAIPVLVWHRDVLALTDWPNLVYAGTTCVLVVLAYGLFYQVFSIAMGRGAGISVFVVAAFVMLAPWAVGAIYNWPLLSGLSPV